MLLSLIATSLLFTPAADPLMALEERGETETFLAMLEMSGIRGELERLEGDYTLFAPRDAAFQGVPPETVARLFEPRSQVILRSILLGHVVLGDVEALELLQRGGATSQSKFRLTAEISGGQLTVGGAGVVAQDLTCTSGTAHILASVILPDPSVLESTPQRRVAARARALASKEGMPESAQVAIYQTAIASLAEMEGADAGILEARSSVNSTLQELEAVIAGVLGDTPLAVSNPLTKPIVMEDDTSLRLIEFNGRDEDPSWYTLNDDVMGGISKSRFELTDGDGGVAVFSGALSMENNGGFASIRSSLGEYDLTGYAGLRLRVKTDGREYGVSAVAGDGRGRTGSWRKRFQVAAGEWTTVDIPFDDMVLNIRGRKYPDVGPPKREAIVGFSIIIGDKDETPFRFEIDSISAYRK